MAGSVVVDVVGSVVVDVALSVVVVVALLGQLKTCPSLVQT